MARDLLKAGEMGDLIRLEVACGDIYDYVTHYIDMFGCYNQDENVYRDTVSPAKWVMGQMSYRTGSLVFGTKVENQAIGVHNRLIGMKGVIGV